MNKLTRFSVLCEEQRKLTRLCLFRCLKKEKIHYGQISVLLALKGNDGCNQCFLAELLEVSRASIGVSLRRMEKSGLVRRETDRKDTRYNRVFVTDEGRKVLKRAEEVVEEVAKRTLEGFTEEEITSLVSMMERMNVNLKEAKNLW